MAWIEIEQIPVLKDNYIYLLHEPGSGATAAVDPAMADPVSERLEAKGWRLSHILNTHHHNDHVGGNLELKARTGAVVVGARADSHRIPGLDLAVGQGDTILIGGAAAAVLAVPGHTSGHIAYWFAESGALFCGDTLFSLGCGRLFEGSPAQMWSSLVKIRSLPDETRIYCAHEYSQSNARFAQLIERENPKLRHRMAEIDELRRRGRPTIPCLLGDEKAANPFLRADQAAVAQGVGLGDADPVAVFAEIRRRKDVF